MSSLASQLANISAGNNSAQVLDKKKKKKLHSVSLIYEPKEAAGQDYETIYFDALEALNDLQLLDHRFKSFENNLFAETSISVDREVQTQEQNSLLDKAVEAFLALAAPRLNLQPALRALEWLVRRFQIHVHNSEKLILTAIPYYNQPVFVRLLDIIPTPFPKLFGFLEPTKKSAQNPPRNLIIRALTNDRQLYETLSEHVATCVKDKQDYHTMLAFWSSFSIWCMVSMKESGAEHEAIADRYLPVVSALLKTTKRPDAQVAGYMVLVVLATQLRLDFKVREAAIKTIAMSWTKESLKSGLACVTQLVKGDEDAEQFVDPIRRVLSNIDDVATEVIDLAEKYEIQRFVVVWALAVFDSQEDIGKVLEVLGKIKMSDYELGSILRAAVQYSTSGKADVNTKSQLVKLFDSQSNERLNVVTRALSKQGVSIEKLELALQSSLKLNTKDSEANAVAQEDVSMEEESENEIETTPVEVTKDNVDSYLAVSTDIASRVALLTNLVASGKKINLEGFKLKSGSEASFLARVWVGSYPVLTRAEAINQFIDLIEKTSIDYQAIIPCLLLGLTDDSERIRRLCGSAMAAMAKRYPMKKATSWGVDSVYGPEDSSNVMFLGSDQVKVFLGEVIEPKTRECAMDSECIIDVVQGAYSKDKKFGEALWQYMHSHSLGANLPQLKTVLLRLANRDGKNDAKSFSPLFDSWIADRNLWIERCEKERVAFKPLEEQVLALVTNGDKTSIKFLETCVKDNSDSATVAGEQIVANWHRMRHDSQLTIIRFLVDIAIDEESDFDTMLVLNNVKITCPHFVSILSECQLDTTQSDQSPVVAKRRRRSSSSNSTKHLMPGSELATIAERHLRKVTVALELLERNKPDASVDLLTHLFSILRDLTSIGHETRLPVEYVEQVLGNCMITAVKTLREKAKRTDKFDSNAIRIDLVVDCIRSSTSPQVQNRFLLLVAELAALDREIVLHGVMPIFTFMGANTVRKDDEYSAHIIQHTVECVIPALFADDRNQEDVDYILTSFATALSHIPRHRRVKMFSTLIRTIGVDVSFYRFLMLMGIKYHELMAAHHVKDANGLATFGESLCRSFSPVEQLHAINLFLGVVENVPLEEEEGADKTVFNQTSFFKNAQSYNSNNLKKFAASLYDYVGQLLGGGDIENAVNGLSDKSGIEEECSQIIAKLLAAQANVRHVEEVSEKVFTALERTLCIMPIDDFVAVVGQLADREDLDSLIKARALSLLRNKFESERAEDARAQRAFVAGMEFCSRYIASDDCAKDPTLLISCLDGLDVMVSRFGAALPVDQHNDKLVPLLDAATGDRGLLNSNPNVYVTSVALTSSLCLVLGARMIAHFPKIVPVALKRSMAAVEADTGDDDSDAVQLASLALFAGLVKRIPAFMSSSLPKILQVAFKSTVDLEPRQQLVETVIESVPFKDSINALAQTWSIVAATHNVDSVSLHLNALDIITDSCRKKEFAPFATVLINMLIEAFGIRSSGEWELHNVNRIETMVCSSGLKMVLKLNDKAFRPLFVKMVRWAFDNGSQYDRMIPVAKFVVKVVTTLKQLVTDYFGYLVDPVCDTLDKLKEEPNEMLKRQLLLALTASFQHDRDEFWQSQARFIKVTEALTDQIPVVENNLGSTLVKAITTLAEACASHDNNRVINDAVCKHIHESCTAHEKIWAIRTLKSLYSRLGEEWVSMLPQLVPLIAELLEDDSEKVQDEVRLKLSPVVEDVLGEKLDRFLS